MLKIVAAGRISSEPVCEICGESAGEGGALCPVHLEEACHHEPDLTTMTIADAKHVPSKVVYDVACRHCGRSGAFLITMKKIEVDW